MKALLLKDWYILRKQLWVWFVLLFIWSVVPTLYLNLMAVVYGAMIPLFRHGL